MRWRSRDSAGPSLDRGDLVVIGNKPLRLGCQWDCRRRALTTRLGSRGRKRVIMLDPPRAEVIDAYKAADLFVFGSQVECSPLVLFEAAASATPFVTVGAGNAAEIAEWTGGGIVVPSERQPDGRFTATPEALRRRRSRGSGGARGPAPTRRARAGGVASGLHLGPDRRPLRGAYYRRRPSRCSAQGLVFRIDQSQHRARRDCRSRRRRRTLPRCPRRRSADPGEQLGRWRSGGSAPRCPRCRS